MVRKYLLSIVVGVAAVTAAGTTTDYTQYVNTLQGTDSNFGLSRGNTYPTAGMPYGVHFWSAQTGRNGDGFKYTYSADAIRGFAQAHQCSPWVSDYAVYSFMPVVGDLVVNEDARATRFSHDNETGRPHYYAVTLDNGITTEMAPTERGVHLRFSFPAGKDDAWLVLDGYTEMSSIHIDPKRRTVSGWVNNQRFFNDSKSYRNYFFVEFDKPFEAWGLWENVSDSIMPGATTGVGKGYGAYLKFKPGTKVQAKAASSYISAEQARVNLDSELGDDRTLEATKERGRRVWNDLLSRVKVEGGTDEELRTFYSCLFRSNLFSRMFYELRPDGTPYYYSP
ncbi:MAG: glycoside hydrolase family 92 protein, partial [Muribaculaceae bacterium]|nr:glycoside hydrolase family 92 protein [Muribaculaceae bacterium]